MEPGVLDELIKRYEGGDRSPELIQALNDAAWTGFHDPWEPGPPQPKASDKGAPMDTETIQPFTLGTIECYLKGRNLSMWKADGNAILVFLGYDKVCDRGVRAMHFVEGKRNTVYRLRIVADRRVDVADYAKARELCDKWNASYRWPRAYLEILNMGEGEGEADSGLLALDYQLLLDKGIHQALFNDLVSDAQATSWDFWKMAREQFNL
jgi:hypothetical protein